MSTSDVAGRVRGPKELRAHDGHEVGLAVEDDELGGDLAGVDRRHAVGERRLGVRLGTAVEQVDDALFRELLGDGVHLARHQRSGCRLCPRTGDGARLKPAVVDVDVIVVAEAALEDQRTGVDDALCTRMARHRLQHGRTVDRHQNRRRVAHQHLRRRVLHLDGRRLDARQREGRLQPIQRNRSHVRGEAFLQIGGVLRSAIGQRRKVRFGDLQVLEHHHARDLVDLRSRRGEDHAEGFRRRPRRLDRQRGAEIELIAVPLIDLRLVDEHRGVGNADIARPRVGRQLGGSRRRRSGLRGSGRCECLQARGGGEDEGGDCGGMSHGASEMVAGSSVPAGQQF